MFKYANAIATWVSIFSAVIGGSIWVGALASDVSHNGQAIVGNQQQIDKLRNEGPPAIARLEEKTDNLQKGVDEVKQTQNEILRELRKK